MERIKAQLLVEVNIGDVESKYPNFQFNYADKKDFLQNNIVAGLEHITDEQEYDAGYETVVANTMLDVMDSFVSVGDQIAFSHNTGYMGKDSACKIGTVIEIKFAENLNKNIYVITYLTKSGRKAKITRYEDEVISIYDFLEAI